MNALDLMLLKAKLGFAGFVEDFRNDERGLSGVVVAVLLILVAVLAVVLIWALLGDWLQELWDSLTGTASEGLQPAA